MNAIWRAAFAAAVAALVAGCGGGGDGKGEDGSGLIPAAPAPGATLFSDATVLRPMVAGATWQYEGTDHDGSSYTNLVTQAPSAVGVIESASNTLGGGSGSVHLAVVDKNVVQLDAVFSDGTAVDLEDPIELRSPIRVNDQIVVFDEREPDPQSDADGDGTNDPFLIAMYRRVIGMETVQLPASQAREAVRVETVLTARVLLSTSGMTQHLFTETTSAWYAPSLGIVRRQRSFVGPDGGAIRSAEDLAAWSGLPD